jgi:GTP-dependent phosphoenolpyruvate carboxykinase
MATRIYAINPGEGEFFVTEGVGSANATKNIEVTVNIANTVITQGGTTRSITREEVLEGLSKIENHIISGIWPPA